MIWVTTFSATFVLPGLRMDQHVTVDCLIAIIHSPDLCLLNCSAMPGQCKTQQRGRPMGHFSKWCDLNGPLCAGWIQQVLGGGAPQNGSGSNDGHWDGAGMTAVVLTMFGSGCDYGPLRLWFCMIASCLGGWSRCKAWTSIHAHACTSLHSRKADRYATSMIRSNQAP